MLCFNFQDHAGFFKQCCLHGFSNGYEPTFGDPLDCGILRD
jgi:hypothetical protein